MIEQSINDSTRTAAMDGALSFSILIENHRELTLGSAQSSVSGLLSAIRSAPAQYAALLEAATATVALQSESSKYLTDPAWTDTSAATKATLEAALQQALDAYLAQASPDAQAAKDAATAAKNGATNPSSEYTYASDIESAADLLLTAIQQLQSNEDASAAQLAADARARAEASLAQATTLLATLNSQNPLPTGRIAATQAVIDAANATLAAADEVDAAVSSGAAAAAGETPTSYELTSSGSPQLYLTTWGAGGTISITDATGVGVLISSDGRVDTIPPSGDGWSFKTDSTFLLPDGTKISVKPGSPASVLATRGLQQISITGLEPGKIPKTSLKAEGGVAADRNWNDGYIFEMGADARVWSLSGDTLGDTPGVREEVATTPLDNERDVDVSTLNLSADLLELLDRLGIDPASFDKNKDGKFGYEELAALTDTIEALVGGVQTQFDDALRNTGAALESLQRLNHYLEKLMTEADRRDTARKEVSAEERDQLQRLQRELNEARRALRPTVAVKSEGFSGGEVVHVAKIVLNQVATLTAPVAPNAESAPTEPSPSPGQLSGKKSSPDSDAFPDAAPVSKSLRRAERLLSGILGINTRAETLQASSAPPSPTQDLAPDVSASQLLSESDSADRVLSPPPGALPPVESAPTRTPNVPTTTPAQSARDSSVPVPPQPMRVGETLPLAQSPASEPLLNRSAVSPTPLSAFGFGADNGVDTASPQHPPAPPLPPLQPQSASDLRPAEPSLDQPAKQRIANPNTPPVPVVADDPETVSVSRAPAAPANDFGVSILGNAAALTRSYQRRIDQFRQVYSEQLSRARNLQGGVRETVERFLVLVGQDVELSKVFSADDLSDDQRAAFRDKIEQLEKEVGISWGSDGERSPQAEANLTARLLRSGMMI